MTPHALHLAAAGDQSDHTKFDHYHMQESQTVLHSEHTAQAYMCKHYRFACSE